MTTRRASLSYLMLMPVLAHGAPSAAVNRWCDTPDTGPSYRTRPGTAALPPRYSPPAGLDANARLAWWNEAALNTLVLDATPAFPGQPSIAAEQPGPTRSSRAMAIVHLAIFDALNAIRKRYPPYAAALTAYADSSFDAAIAQAAHDTLAALFPRQAPRLDALLAQDLARLPGGRSTLNGIEVGRKAADAILTLRALDGSEAPDPVVGAEFIAADAPGRWRPDPVSRNPIALGAYWGRVKPFVLASSAQFRIPPVPALDSLEYTAAFDEVRRLGADGIHAASSRTSEQTAIGIFWGYDGSAWIGPRPRQYNQIAVQLALARTRDPLELARVLALVNVAIADGAIAAWDSKYHWQLWRPVTAIRAAGYGSGPTGRGDGNPAARGDPAWTPLGSPASNLIGPNFTPPFPACPSGHATLGSAMFQVMRSIYGEATGFTLLSDELNGITRDNLGRVRPRLLRSYASLTQAEEENARSRIYLGVHWDFDMMEGMKMGRRVGEYVLRRGLVQPGA
jgi:membrane-associated phospholipid phosphatase